MNSVAHLLNQSIMDFSRTLVHDWQTLFGHILVQGFLQLLHVYISIFIWHLVIGVPKSAEDIIKLPEIKDVMESKFITFIHGAIHGGPSVTAIWDENLAIYVYSITNPLGEILKIH